MLKLAVFDMDGLLVDSERIMMETIESVCDNMGYHLNETEYRACMGAGSPPDFHAIIPDVPEDEILTVWKAVMSAMTEAAAEASEKGIPVKPGVSDLLDWLGRHGVTRAVCSSSDRPKVEMFLKSGGIYDRFELVICGGETGRGKPAPDIFLAACAAAGVIPAEAMVFEDSGWGGMAAEAAGIPYVIIPDLAVLGDDVKKNALMVADSLEEVVPFLEAVQEEMPYGHEDGEQI